MDEKIIPVTMWYSQIGNGDSQDYATRGYLTALMKANYEGLRLAPSKYTSILKINDPVLQKDLAVFSDLVRPPDIARMKPLVRVQAGDPRIGTTRRINNVEVEITEGSVDLDVPQQFTLSVKSEVKCVVVHHDPTSICRTYAFMVKPGRARGVAYVGVTAWESSHIPQSIAIILSELDLIIAPSIHTKKALERGGVTCPVSIVPYTFDDKLWPCPTKEELESNLDGRYVFYTIATPIERKNLLGLVTAYYRAFSSEDNVVLRIKTEMDAIQAQALLDKAAKIRGFESSRPLVKFYPGTWLTDKIRAFHLDGNCYVSATRGEGFGLPEMEARLCGRPVITTNWGAVPEIIAPTVAQEEEISSTGNGPYRSVEGGQYRTSTPGTSYVHLIHAYEIPVEGMHGIGCYEPDQKWADPDPVELSSVMRSVYILGPCHDAYSWEYIKKRFGEETVGMQLAAVLRQAQEAAQAEGEELDGFQQG